MCTVSVRAALDVVLATVTLYLVAAPDAVVVPSVNAADGEGRGPSGNRG